MPRLFGWKVNGAEPRETNMEVEYFRAEESLALVTVPVKFAAENEDEVCQP